MSADDRPYNPLDRVELGKSVERALLARPLGPLPPAGRFPGAGLYAIYYTGSLPLYEPISPPSRPRGDIPIYVGRAQSKGARRGIVQSLEATTPEAVLYNRLRQHALSIERVEAYFASQSVEGLRLNDFLCRYLVADDIWVPLGEALLIAHYRPVWNVVVDGFGNHAPGGGREGQRRSPWDELHPGREWAFRLPAARQTADEIEELVRAHLTEYPEPDLDAAPRIDEPVRAALAAETELDEPEG